MVKIVLALPHREPQQLTFGEETTLDDLRAIAAAEMGADDVNDIQLLCSGRPLLSAPSTSLGSLLRDDNTVEAVFHVPSQIAPAPQIPAPAAAATGGEAIAQALKNFFSAPQSAAVPARAPAGLPVLPQPFVAQDPGQAAMLHQGLQQFFSSPQAREQARRIELVRRLEQNPLDTEAQMLLEELIREVNVEENREYALENNPEVFVRVHMLFCRCTVNGVPLLAMVDTGAETSIMSADFAEKSGLTRLIDKRYKGVARGVGEAKIVGRVHTAPIKIGEVTLPCAFTIVEGAHLDFLLGLDLLRRHQCIVDIKSDVLRIGNETVPFLRETEIPHNPSFDT